MFARWPLKRDVTPARVFRKHIREQGQSKDQIESDLKAMSRQDTLDVERLQHELSTLSSRMEQTLATAETVKARVRQEDKNGELAYRQLLMSQSQQSAGTGQLQPRPRMGQTIRLPSQYALARQRAGRL